MEIAWSDGRGPTHTSTPTPTPPNPALSSTPPHQEVGRRRADGGKVRGSFLWSVGQSEGGRMAEGGRTEVFTSP